MKYNRQKEMLAFIRDNRSVSNEQLLKQFNISIQTLRRDIKRFEQQGLIAKVYGGVIYNDRQESVSSVDALTVRNASLVEEKEYIGKLAARQVRDDDVIFIDSGTTAYRMLNYMKDLKSVTVISHSLDVMLMVRDMSNITGICVGGVVLHDSGTFIADTSLYPFNYTKAFISTVGISTIKDLTNTNLHEGSMKATAIRQSEETYVMADHSKFGVVAYNHFADLKDIDAIITDRCPDNEYVSFFEGSHIRLIY